jgi:hypothetical protein
MLGEAVMQPPRTPRTNGVRSGAIPAVDRGPSGRAFLHRPYLTLSQADGLG